MDKEFDYLIYIGRFQPFHNGHLEVLRRALARAHKVVVVLGSGRRARNIKNPFSDSERAQMIASSVKAMDENAAERLVICPVRDYYDNDKWVAAVKKAVAGITERNASLGHGKCTAPDDETCYARNPHPNPLPTPSPQSSPASGRGGEREKQSSIPAGEGANERLREFHVIGIIGHLKDASSYYLHEFPEWRLVHEDNYAGLSATDLRQCLFAEVADPQAWERLALAVPLSVLEFLNDFRMSSSFSALSAEFAAVEKSRAAWAAAPYPPVFVTVDAVVRCNGHVLLIRRGGHPGRGQWALPGGFVEQDERLQDAAIRELAEETSFAIPSDALRNVIAGAAVFDTPNRSVRGRTITHAFFFDLGQQAFPPVAAADDAAEARWFAIDTLCDMEAEIFEDHIHIMDGFLKIL